MSKRTIDCQSFFKSENSVRWKRCQFSSAFNGMSASLGQALVLLAAQQLLYVYFLLPYTLFLPGNKVVKNPLATAGEARFRGSIRHADAREQGKDLAWKSPWTEALGDLGSPGGPEAHDWGSEYRMAFKDQHLLTQTTSTVSSHTFLSKTRFCLPPLFCFGLLWSYVCALRFGLTARSKVFMSRRPARRNSICAEEPLMLFFFAFVPLVQMWTQWKR